MTANIWEREAIYGREVCFTVFAFINNLTNILKIGVRGYSDIVKQTHIEEFTRLAWLQAMSA